jgi:hypothetical protein
LLEMLRLSPLITHKVATQLRARIIDATEATICSFSPYWLDEVHTREGGRALEGTGSGAGDSPGVGSRNQRRT